MAKVRELLFGGHDPYYDVAQLPFNSHGWSSEHPVFDEVIAEVKPKLIVEVGTWLGGSARYMANAAIAQGIEDLEIVCIDTFLGSVEMWDRSSYIMDCKNGRPTIYDQFLSNTLHTGFQNIITPFPCDSQNAFLTLKNFNVVPDLVYIDAGHDFFSVLNDLQNWSSIIRPGGILIGDDWFHVPIKEAVDSIWGVQNVEGHGAKFIWRK